MVHKCRVEKAEDGHRVPIIVCDGKDVHLGSMYDGEYAARCWVENSIPNDMENVFLFGMGDGEILIQICRVIPGNIVVYEPNEDIYREMRHSSLIRKLVSDKRVSIQHGTTAENVTDLYEALRVVLNDNWVDETVAVCHPAYNRLYPQTLKMFLDICRDLAQQVKDMRAAIKRFNRAMTVNQLHNIPYMENGVLLTRLKEGWRKEIPIIIVSGGPSLDKNVEFLRGAKDKAYLFCVDVALPTLLAHGIRPDLIGCLDAQKNMSFYSDKSSHDIPLLVTEQVPDELLRKSTGKRVWVFLNSYMRAVAEKAGVGVPQIQYHLGVAVQLFAAALELGAGEIILVGQDLSYSEDGRTHADGRNEGMVKDERYQLDGYYGKKVWSRYDWYITWEWFERMVREHSDRVLINATEGGVRIAGMLQKPLKGVVETLPVPEEPADLDLVLADERFALMPEEFDVFMAERARCIEELEMMRRQGYHKTFFQEDYRKLPAARLVIDAMKSHDDPSRQKRFEQALDYVEDLCKKEIG